MSPPRGSSPPSPTPASGAYNSMRAVPPPRARPSSNIPSHPYSSTAASPSFPSHQPPRMSAPDPRSGKRLDPFVTRVIILVDEATEPGISDQDAERRRQQLVSIVLDRNLEQLNIPPAITNITGGQAVALALRKRLKSEDEIAVLNTIALLDELMRTCPYFYRFVANDKFFRRMWRFVVPDYKNGVKSMIPIFGKPKIHAGMRTDSDVSSRVLILIRAWAEELSVMHQGRYDQFAGFLIERYNNKRGRVAFPEVPKTPLPWVCPVNGSADYLRGSSSSRNPSSSDPFKETMNLATVENTVNLFANLVEKASSIGDLNEDVCTELAERCKYIHSNMSRLSMNMSKEAELMRAIAVSETLEKTLTQYNSSLANGRIVREVPTVDSISLQSEDEGYGGSDRNDASYRSFDNYAARSDGRVWKEYRPDRYSDSSDLSNGTREQWEKREADRERDRERDMGRNGGRDGDRDLDREREDDRVEPRPRERGSTPPRLQRSLTTVEKKKPLPSKELSEKRSRRDQKPPSLRRRQKSDSELPKLAKEKKKPIASASKKESSASASKKAAGLIELSEDGDCSSEEEGVEGGEQGNDESFTMLAERYASHKVSRQSKSKAKAGGQSGGPSIARPPSQQRPSPESSVVGSTQSVPHMTGPVPNQNAAAMYNSVGPGVGYNPMMMVSNPFAMYGSVGAVPMQDPMAMYGAYQTVNPSMYYSTVNPHMYSTFSAPGMHMPSAQLPQMGQSPGIQRTAQQSPVLHSVPQNGSAQASMPQVTSVPEAAVSPEAPLQRSRDHLEAMPQAGMSSMTGMPGMPGPPGMPSMPSLPSMPSMPSMPGMPGMAMGMQTPMESYYGSVSGAAPYGMMMPGGAGGMGSGDGLQQGGGSGDPNAQAAAYQSAMNQAAAAYHAAANAYRSVSGHAPVDMSGAGSGPASGPAGAGQSSGGGGGGSDGAERE